MKRLLVAVLVLSLLLAGCANGTQVETTVQSTQSSQPAGLYESGSALEQQTGGAVRQYDLGRSGYHGLYAIGDQLLLLSGTEQTQLELLSGAQCVPVGSTVLPVDLRQGGFQITYNGFAYYDAQEHQAVYLDPQLQEADRIQLPGDMQGQPAFSPDGAEIFYCVGQEIRALDTERGLSRLIKSHSCASQTLLGAFFEGKLVLCSAESEAGERSLLYVSTENGATLSTDNAIERLYTYDDQYLAIRMDGITGQRIFGALEGTPQQLNVSDTHVVSALELGGALGICVDQSSALLLSYYDLAAGKKTAAVTLPEVGEPVGVWADRWSGCLWILTGTDTQKLLRWDVKASATGEEAACNGPVYTADAPNKAGLDALQDRVDALNKQHGTTIRIWEAAVKTNGGYDLEPEHQTSAIESTLNDLEQVLSQFPENFLYKSVSSRIRICIVRSVNGERTSVRYWDDGDAFIVLSVGVDVENAFIQAVGYIVDSHILGNSPLLDAWEGLNPEGFTYGSDAQWSDEYLEGQSRAFVDGESMNSVSDDRARVFWQAMQKDNAAMFESDTMQAKLLLLCQSIRDAWRLERKTETYLWEQYLAQSIAYQG